MVPYLHTFVLRIVFYENGIIASVTLGHILTIKSLLKSGIKSAVDIQWSLVHILNKNSC